LLEPSIQVTHIPVNSLFPATGLACVHKWLGPTPNRWDYITLGPWHGIGNCSAQIHTQECDSFPKDHSLDKWPRNYVAQMQNLTAMIQAHNPEAKLLLLYQTPVCSNHACCDASLANSGHCNDVISIYNAATDKALQKQRVIGVDLFNVVNSACGVGFAQCNISLCTATVCNVHFNNRGWDLLGKHVAEVVEQRSADSLI